MTLTINTNSPHVLKMHVKAQVRGWTDESFYGDADCDLTQTFRRSNITVHVEWRGEGSHDKVRFVRVTRDWEGNTNRAGYDGVLFHDQLANPTQLEAEAWSALSRDYE